MEKQIEDILKRRQSGEPITSDESWELHLYFYKNDSIYKKAWHETLKRNKL